MTKISGVSMLNFLLLHLLRTMLLKIKLHFCLNKILEANNLASKLELRLVLRTIWTRMVRTVAREWKKNRERYTEKLCIGSGIKYRASYGNVFIFAVLMWEEGTPRHRLWWNERVFLCAAGSLLPVGSVKLTLALNVRARDENSGTWRQEQGLEIEKGEPWKWGVSSVEDNRHGGGWMGGRTKGDTVGLIPKLEHVD